MQPPKSSSDPNVYLRIIHSNMMSRCYNVRHESYPFYGGKGVTVFEPWHDVNYFVADVLSLIGERPSGVRRNGLAVWEFDRINSYGNYEPGNVRWLENWKNQANKRQRVVNTQPRQSKVRSEYPQYLQFVKSTSGIVLMNGHI